MGIKWLLTIALVSRKEVTVVPLILMALCSLLMIMVNLCIPERMIHYLIQTCALKVADVGIDQTSYTVPEDVGLLEVQLSITSEQMAPGQDCQIQVTTTDGSAEGELKITI